MSKRELIHSPDSRREHIQELLNRRGECSVEELARQFAVSTMTIRRDLQDLAATGRVLRTHGGATPGSRISFEFRYLARMQEQRAAKEAIGAYAAGLVRPGESVILDSGTTTLSVAAHLRGKNRLTVVTASLPIASVLYGCPEIELLLLGGYLRHDLPDLMGDITESNLDILKVDVAFTGADGIDERGYVYQTSAAVAGWLQKITKPARRVYVVADHTKFGKTALLCCGNLKNWTGWITDAGTDQATVNKLRRVGARVIKAAGADSE